MLGATTEGSQSTSEGARFRLRNVRLGHSRHKKRVRYTSDLPRLATTKADRPPQLAASFFSFQIASRPLKAFRRGLQEAVLPLHR